MLEGALTSFLGAVRGKLGRAERGLYHGKKVMSGNNVSFSKNRCVFPLRQSKAHGPECAFLTRTKRKWKPNIQTKRLLSDELDEVAAPVAVCVIGHGPRFKVCCHPLQLIKLRVSTHALRCIDKAGGLDSYIMGLKKVQPGTKEFELKVPNCP